MKRAYRSGPAHAQDVVFQPAIMPFEASVLPALEKSRYGTLGMIRYAWAAGEAGAAQTARSQRAKIWVR